MKIQWLNTISFDTISGGNRYNTEVIEGLKRENFLVDCNACISKKSYDISIIDSLASPKLPLFGLKNLGKLYLLVHEIPKLTSEQIQFYKQHCYFICTGPPAERWLVDNWKIKSDKIKLIRPGLPSYWKKKKTFNNFARKLVINANFTRGKNYEWLIPILYYINNKAVEVNIIANNNLDPQYTAFITKVFERSKCSQRLHFYFNIAPSLVYTKLLQADLLLSLSGSETFGMAIYEGLSVGLPCLAFETGDVDFFKQFPNYCSIQNCNIKKMARILKLLCESEKGYKALCHTKIPYGRTWEKVAKEFTRLFK